jgi:hypothetical protein
MKLPYPHEIANQILAESALHRANGHDELVKLAWACSNAEDAKNKAEWNRTITINQGIEYPLGLAESLERDTAKARAACDAFVKAYESCCKSYRGNRLCELMQPAIEEGNLIFNRTQTATVNYWAEKDASGEWHGRITNAEGYPNWHPIVSIHPGPFTLVMSDGRKLKVFLESLEGVFHGTEN